MTGEIGPLPYCPGCGHNVLVKALDRALVKLQLDPKMVVMVTDIGCIGLSDRHFTTNAFHGLHGRAITYACGLKLARPELVVIALKGDGGCGIGGTHLLNVARRNIGISLIVANNFNYGMTGGQHSVTTPPDGVTTTTPWGNVERPMDLCGTAIAAGAAWVCRATMFDKKLPDAIARTIEQPGFAFLEVLELCTAYYSPRNKMNKAAVDELLKENDLSLGLLVDKPRPEYSARYREALEATAGAPLRRSLIEARYDNAVTRQTGIILAGSAGQKIRSSAALFAQAAMFSGLDATQKDDYPITVMTGHSLAEVIVSNEPIDYTAIDAPDVFVVTSEDGLQKTRARLAQLPKTCTLYADEALELPGTEARVVQLPWAATARKISRLSIAVVALAGVLQDSGMYPVESLAAAISNAQKPSIAEINLKAVEAGAALVKR
jgi:pyruvate/2-oxoacid:ferredoxin oxidoreductase beta subunit/Pyruvate/2-oxoacid:ferredoxin oxidoreductase gamma subunit